MWYFCQECSTDLLLIKLKELSLSSWSLKPSGSNLTFTLSEYRSRCKLLLLSISSNEVGKFLHTCLLSRDMLFLRVGSVPCSQVSKIDTRQDILWQDVGFTTWGKRIDEHQQANQLKFVSFCQWLNFPILPFFHFYFKIEREKRWYPWCSLK